MSKPRFAAIFIKAGAEASVLKKNVLLFFRKEQDMNG